MITRHHLFLTLLYSCILCCAFFPVDLVWSGLFILGAEMGAVLPDIQIKKPSRARSFRFAYYVTRFSERICIPVLCSVYRIFLPFSPDKKDKRLTHSFPGITGIFFCIAILLIIPVRIVAGTGMDLFIVWLLAGLALGLLLHLGMDLCTRKGIFPFFPFSPCQIKGSIRPCDTRDHRIGYFHLLPGIFLGCMILLILHSSGTDGLIYPAGITGFITSIGIMVFFSGIQFAANQTPCDSAPSDQPVAG